MTAWQAVRTVARREIVERSRTRSLRISLAVLLVAVVVGAVAAARIGASTPTDDVGLVGADSAQLVPALRAQADAAGRRVRLRRPASRAAAERALRDGRLDVAVVD
ncbi:MAG TPA: hypothetical protein VHB30_10215, partial [Solirubrobacteraceae bacterium]|nr:hypothetical protein [Solirubrobacteraceae bacterium]